MANILFLCHRLPYPPNKGDKVRSYHLLKHLSGKHSVHLGTFLDDPEDEHHIEALRSLCVTMHVARLRQQTARLRSLNGLLAGDPLTLRYFRDAGLQDWVNNLCAHSRIDAVVVFCSSMAQYVVGKARLPTIVDFVDVDSEKWRQYAAHSRWPMSWIYARESKLLGLYERQVASLATRSFFVTEQERALFLRHAPECGIRVDVMQNGVDHQYFDPEIPFDTPFEADELPIVVTGTMSYRINEEGILWFAEQVLPALSERFPKLRFHIVGRQPGQRLQALASERIKVVGTVPDVRPYLRHAALVVAPMHISRGIPNKILEAMSMGKAVVAHGACAAAVDAEADRDYLVADHADAFIAAITACLNDPEHRAQLGKAARIRMLSHYEWQTNLSRIDTYLGQPTKDIQ